MKFGKEKWNCHFSRFISCADFDVVVVNKRLLGHSKKSQQVSPQISRLNRVLMNLNERGEGIFEVFGVFWSFLECPSNLLLTTTFFSVHRSVNLIRSFSCNDVLYPFCKFFCVLCGFIDAATVGAYFMLY